jgi:hypothetical protein
VSTEEKRPTFPYSEIWEEFSDEMVTIEQLGPKLMVFRTRFRLLAAVGSPTPYVETNMILALMGGLELPRIRKERLAELLYLVAGYYLGRDHLKQWNTDVRSSALALRKIQKSASGLSKSLRQISAGVSRALAALSNIDPDALETKPTVDTAILLSQLARLETIAGIVVNDITIKKRGRSTDAVRLNAVRLAVELTEAAGAGRASMSSGNRGNPEPHFTGPAGIFVRDFFKLIAPKQSERVLVGALTRLRRAAG